MKKQDSRAGGQRARGGQYLVLACSAVLATLSALAVVISDYDSRRLFRELQEYRSEARALEVDWKRLLLEEGAWQDHARIEQIARDQLGMRTPQDQEILMMRLPL